MKPLTSAIHLTVVQCIASAAVWIALWPDWQLAGAVTVVNVCTIAVLYIFALKLRRPEPVAGGTGNELQRQLDNLYRREWK